MITSITSIARLARPTRAVSAAVLVAGALAAGCGTVAANPGGTNEPNHTAGTSGTTSASAPAASPTAVPTVTGGPVTTGDPACVGWPSNAPHGTLTAFFEPVSVERCVNGFTQVPGKGEWQTATLEKSTDNLAALVTVLLKPSGTRQPGVFCPELAVIPPQFVLINSAGKQLIPRLPVSGCGQVSSQVLMTLAAMTWQPVSVRLVSKVPSTETPRTLPGASIGPGSPKMQRTQAPKPAN